MLFSEDAAKAGDDSVEAVGDVVVGEADHAEAVAGQPCFAPFVLFPDIFAVVDTAVDLHDQVPRQATEVDNERTDGVLPTNGDAERVSTECRPESCLGGCLAAAKLAGGGVEVRARTPPQPLPVATERGFVSGGRGGHFLLVG